MTVPYKDASPRGGDVSLGEEQFMIVPNLAVRRSLMESDVLQLVWGEGSYREEFETDSPQLASWLLSLPAMVNKRELLIGASDVLGVEQEEAEKLVDMLVQQGMLCRKPPPTSSAQELWFKLGWHDAVELHAATRHTRWRHEYPPNPQVMTWFHGDKPIEPETPRPVVPDNISAMALELPQASSADIDEDMHSVLDRRRTSRNFAGTSISVRQLANILHWTFRPLIVGGSRRYYTTQSSSDGFREKHTPHPITTYVLLDPLKGPHELLERGWRFRYSPAYHALDPLPDSSSSINSMSDLLWGQDFADGAPAMLVFAINWNQYMWKYRTSFAYRMAHLDLGAFMQTALVVATATKLQTFITPAMDDTRMAEVLGTDDSECAPSYIVALGARVH